MKQKTERRLEDLERETKSRPSIRTVIRDEGSAVYRNPDGTLYDPHTEPLPAGSRVIEIVIVDPPNRPPRTDPPFDPTVKPKLGLAVKSQVRH